MGVLSHTEYNYTLEHQMEQLALESEVLANVINTFRNAVPNLLGMLKEKVNFINEEKDVPEHLLNISKNYKELSKKLPQVPYASVNQTLVSVPENFYGSFLDYSEFLNKHASELYSSANEILSEYHSSLAIFLSNQNSNIGLSDYTNIYRNVKKNREDLTSKFKVYFPKDTGLSKQKLSTVIDRFADLDKLVHEITSLEKNQQKQSLATFKTSVDQCVELLQLVVKRTEEKSLDKISGPTAKNIAEGAFELGKFVELVALFRFRVQQFMVSVENTFSELNTKLV